MDPRAPGPVLASTFLGIDASVVATSSFRGTRRESRRICQTGNSLLRSDVCGFQRRVEVGLCLEQAVDGSGQGLAAIVTDAADQRFDAGLVRLLDLATG